MKQDKHSYPYLPASRRGIPYPVDHPKWKAWAARVEELERQGCCRSDAQGIADAEGLDPYATPEQVRRGKRVAEFNRAQEMKPAMTEEEYNKQKTEGVGA